MKPVHSKSLTTMANKLLVHSSKKIMGHLKSLLMEHPV